ncbi:hypothetical protein COOONC_24392 [Cooperia oncophora]
MAIAYSTTKIWAGLTSAILAGRGLLHYDEKVSSFWPEFAKNGKGSTTIRDVLDHRAGLITFHKEFGVEEAKDLDVVSGLIEDVSYRLFDEELTKSSQRMFSLRSVSFN